LFGFTRLTFTIVLVQVWTFEPAGEHLAETLIIKLPCNPRKSPVSFIQLNYKTLPAMLKNTFKTLVRGLLRNKGYSFLNIGGLAIGIACAGLMSLWIADELSFDNFNQNKDKLYQVQVSMTDGGNNFTMTSTPRLLFSSLKAEVPGVANSCRFLDEDIKSLFTFGNKKQYATGRYADPQLFSMFTIPFVQGDAHKPFPQLYSIVLTEQTALRFFGTTRGVIGKVLRMNNAKDYLVSGVIKDMPRNSSLQFDWLAPYQVQMQEQMEQYGKMDSGWSSYGPFTYVQLAPGTDVNAVNARIVDFIHHKDATQKSSIFLFPMNQWRLYSDFANGRPTGSGRIAQVRLMGLIAGIILLIACINFMNLATARSEKRAKEIGVRKVLGSGRRRLIFQFLAEAMLMSAAATALAIGLMALTLPAFNQLVQKQLQMGWLNPAHILGALALTLICGLLAGSYPALYLSSFDPVGVLKGLRIKSGGAAFVRQGLVVLQFGISVVFIISTIVVYQQVQHVKGRNLGFDKDNLLEVDLQHDSRRNFPSLRQDLLHTGAVENAALAGHSTLYGGDSDGDFSWAGKDPKQQLNIFFRLVSSDFIQTSGMHVWAGHDFTGTAADTASIVVNRAFANMIDTNGVVNKVIQSGREMPRGMFKNMRIIGVVDNYQFGGIYSAGAPPLILFCNPATNVWQNLAYVRIRPGHASQQTLAAIAAVLKKDDPQYPFQYRFVDDQFNQMFATEVQTSTLSGIFASLAIVISCLGLFSLAAYTAERRLKEIGIRKVLGASVSGLAGLLSKDFLKLVVISCLIAFPTAWWIMHNWLQGYEYRITIQWWIFVLAGLAAVLIAIATVSFQAMKAALMNPVRTLRSE
jgi:putative ABC transport system permease protein